MWWPYVAFFALAGVASFAMSLGIRRFAVKRGIVDDPQKDPTRKLHTETVPLLGGWAIFFGVCIAVLASVIWFPRLIDSFLNVRQLAGILIAALAIMIGGTIDDVRTLSPSKQLVAPICAAVIAIAGGIGVAFITRPFGGIIQLDQVQWTILTVHGVPYHLTLFADAFAFMWLMMMMYATKLLDGLDGLASGIGAIGAIVMFLVSMTKTINQPGTALLAIIIAGACVGLLPLNSFRAKIFLGEGGSLLIGFLLGVLSIIAGAKIATALLIMAFPLLDVLYVMVSRIRRHVPIFSADRAHLHFRLVDAGISQQKAVWLLYCVAGLFGASALVLQSSVKLILLCVAVIASLLLVGFAITRKKTV